MAYCVFRGISCIMVFLKCKAYPKPPELKQILIRPLSTETLATQCTQNDVSMDLRKSIHVLKQMKKYR